jgi:predicted transcriptional regulator
MAFERDPLSEIWQHINKLENHIKRLECKMKHLEREVLDKMEHLKREVLDNGLEISGLRKINELVQVCPPWHDGDELHDDQPDE